MPDRRTATLEFAQFELRPPPDWATVWELSFDLVNTGASKAILRSIRLVVDESHPCDKMRLVEAGAPVTLHHLRVRLEPDTREVDIRGRVFGAPVEPRSFSLEEVESFLLDISSSKGWVYQCRLVLDWYSARKPSERLQTESPSFTLEFEPEPEEMLERLSTDGTPAPSEMTLADERALVQVFAENWEESEMESLVVLGLGRPDILVSRVTRASLAFQIVSWARREGRLAELTSKMLQQKPGIPSIARFAQLWRA